MLMNRTLPGVVIIVGFLLSPLSSQTVRGTVLDDSTSQPVGGAEVMVLDTLGTTVTQAMTDGGGQFRVTVPPGDYSFRITRIGYAPTVTTLLHTTGDAEEVSVVIRVPTSSALQAEEPYNLTPIVVEARPVERHLDDFYRHQQQGQGAFVTRGDFERWRPLQVTDIIRRMPGFEFVGGRIDAISRSHINACPPRVFLDGVHVGTTDTWNLNEYLTVDAVEAIEGYTRRVQVPMEYNIAPTRYTTGADCGVLAIWTRSGVVGGQASPFELGLRFGGAVAGAAFAGGRIGFHLITPFMGPLQLYPALYPISTAFSDVMTRENSSWMAQLAVITTVRGGLMQLHVGTGTVVQTPHMVFREYGEGYEWRHTVLAGMKRRFGSFYPFLELHLLDLITPANADAQIFLGFGMRF